MATGWGALKTFGTTSDALMKVELNIKPNSACSRQFEDNHKLSNGMTSDFICAGSRRRKDTCEGGKKLKVPQISFLINFQSIRLGRSTASCDAGLKVSVPHHRCHFFRSTCVWRPQCCSGIHARVRIPRLDRKYSLAMRFLGL